MKINYLYFLLIPFVALNSCQEKEGCTDESAQNYDADAEKNDGSCTYALNVADTYDGSSFESSSAYLAAKNLVDNEKSLPTNRPTGTNTPKEISKTELISNFSASLAIASSEFKNTQENVFFPDYQINSKATAEGAIINWSDLSQTPNGGKGRNWILNENGVEIEQLMVKGGFAGIAFHHVKNTLFADPKNVSQNQLDGALALYGSNPSFEQKDQSAKYTKDRKKGSGTYHDAISLEFRKAQAAIKQNIPDEKEAAIKNILLLWEEGLAAQVIFYTYDVIDYFSKTNITDDDRSSGCHAWSEGVGIVLGFHKVNGKKISDTQVLSYLSNVNSSANGLGKPYELIANATLLAKLETAINELAAIYGLNKLDHKRN